MSTDAIENLVPLEEVAEKVFGLSPRIARRRAALNTLPVPAFRLHNSRKGPMYVLKSDIETLIESRYLAAKDANMKMAALHAV